MVDVDSWELLLRCPKCGIENEVNLGQIKRGGLFNAMFDYKNQFTRQKWKC
jgi:predicted nucleic-acid-binding Zn-ribbon protein